MSKTYLDEQMSHFVLEACKKEYPPNTLYHICCGIMQYLRNNGKPDLDLFKYSAFANFWMILYSKMKR